MSKVENNLNSTKNSNPVRLSNAPENRPIKDSSLLLQDKEYADGEYSDNDAEKSATKIIAVRLHQLELGQKKILHALSSIYPHVKNERIGLSRQGKWKCAFLFCHRYFIIIYIYIKYRRISIRQLL